MTRRLLLCLLMLWPSLAAAQINQFPFGATPPIVGLPAFDPTSPITPTSVGVPASTCAAPGIYLTTATTTGFAFTATPSVILCVNGTPILSGTSTALTSTVPVVVPRGSAAATVFNFGTAGEGIYSQSAGSIDLAFAGTRRWAFDANTLAIIHDSATISMGSALDVTLSRLSPAILGINSEVVLTATKFITSGGFGLIGLDGSNKVGISTSGRPVLIYGNTTLDNPVTLGWSDVIFSREAAGYSFQRNSTNAQRAAWANTYTSTTNFESFDVDWQTVTNVALVGTRTTATGTSRNMLVGVQGNSAGNLYAGMYLSGSLPNIRLLPQTTNALGNVTDGTAGTFIQLGGTTTHNGTSGQVNFAAICIGRI